jgi:Tfp pilus assembly protein PilF
MAGLVAVLTFLIYLPSLRFQFVFDDVAILVHNPTIRSWSYLPDYFTRDLWQNVQPATGYYRPLLLLWFRLNFAVFGLHPAWWHLTNIAVHIVAAVLVLRLALRLTGSHTLALTAALLFGLHPIHVETVSWLSDAVDALVTAWFLGGVLCFVKSREGSRLWLAGSVACYCGAMFTKEPGFTLPAVLFVYVLFSESEPWAARIRNAVLGILWFIPFSLLYLLARHNALHQFSAHSQSMSFGEFLLTLPGVVWSYVRTLIIPLRLSPFYEFEVIHVPSWSGFVAPLVEVLAVAALVVLIARRLEPAGQRVLGFGLAWFAVTLAPALDLLIFPPSEMAHDRYVYLASVGFCLALAAILMPLIARFRISAVVPLVIFFGIVTFEQQDFWRDDNTLYGRAIQIAPRNALAESGLANLVARRGDYPVAISLYRDILQRDPNNLVANLNLGWAYVLTGNYAEAERYLVYAATHYTNRSDCFFDLGVLYQKTGRLDRALASLRRAESLSPPHPIIEEKISEVQEQQGDLAGAIESMQRAVQLLPANAEFQARLQILQAKHR